MALVKCSECGREISDRASACPHCGCSRASAAQPPSVPKGIPQAIGASRRRPWIPYGVLWGTSGFAIFMALGATLDHVGIEVGPGSRLGSLFPSLFLLIIFGTLGLIVFGLIDKFFRNRAKRATPCPRIWLASLVFLCVGGLPSPGLRAIYCIVHRADRPGRGVILYHEGKGVFQER
jgi:hypothetical protein